MKVGCISFKSVGAASALELMVIPVLCQLLPFPPLISRLWFDGKMEIPVLPAFTRTLLSRLCQGLDKTAV